MGFGWLKWCLPVAVLLACVIMAGGAQAVSSGDQDALRAAIADVENADRLLQSGDRSAESSLSSSLSQAADTLDSLLRGGQFDDRSLVVVRYYRGLAGCLLNEIRRRKGLPVDEPAARRALDDFDYTLKAGGANGFPADWLANLQYRAGSVAFNQAHDGPLAFRYWRACADLQHAGCMNVVAHAMMTGMAGQAVDLKGALAMHKRIFATGATYTCAGAFSGMSIAQMNYFLAVRDKGDDPVEWMRKSIALLDGYAERHDGDDPCGRAGFEITEYLMGLSTGRQDEALLHAVLRHKSRAGTRAVAKFLLNEADDQSVDKAILASPLKYEQCEDHFLMFWAARLTRKAAIAERHFQAITGMSSDDCGSQTLFARAYH